jgi:serine/threonine-protein kinase RsbW
MKSKFTTQCARSNLSGIRRFLHSTLARLEVADPVKQEIVLAVDEACANAIIHGNDCDAAKPLLVEVEKKDGQLMVEISDVGAVTEEELENHRNKTLEELVEERSKGGLGLKLIYSLMDEVSYYSKDNKQVCSLRKKL